ncbi:MAG: T9SS type A sorting domain-containing protein, partial [Bacteroidetes bacterium]|nr:T9SS type A sorting domain-containing protein [Bacteroidota bacterium]
AVYSSYQWYKNGVIINGATSNTYTATSNGLYSIWVMMRAAECQDSASYDLKNLGIAGTAGGNVENVQVIPNPANEFLQATWGSTLRSEDLTGLRLQDMTGRAVFTATAHPVGNSAGFTLPHLANGLYMATFTVNGLSAKTVKLNIQQ